MESATTSKLDFSADVPLKPGNNVATVFAREDEEFQTRRSIVVYRKPTSAVAAETPAPQGIDARNRSRTAFTASGASSWSQWLVPSIRSTGRPGTSACSASGRSLR
jgi:hypothetical protein